MGEAATIDQAIVASVLRADATYGAPIADARGSESFKNGENDVLEYGNLSTQRPTWRHNPSIFTFYVILWGASVQNFSIWQWRIFIFSNLFV